MAGNDGMRQLEADRYVWWVYFKAGERQHGPSPLQETTRLAETPGSGRTGDCAPNVYDGFLLPPPHHTRRGRREM